MRQPISSAPLKMTTKGEGLQFFGMFNGLVAPRSKFDSVTVRKKKERPQDGDLSFGLSVVRIVFPH